MKKSIRLHIGGLLSIAALVLFLNQKTFAHCEIPCGIYGDSVRIALISEHISTIEKSMNQINELSTAGNTNYNQLVRWVINKEEHAVKIQEIVSQYFLHQRIKPVDPANAEAYQKYHEHLELLHHLQVNAMKAKQTTDLTYIDNLRSTLTKFEKAYFHTHD
jgi:nickel superoxide dismutase